MQEADQIAFSVVIPVYNRAHLILPTLESVLVQTHVNFTCLVVDDGSIDGEELRSVVEGLGDPRFRYIRQSNGGGGAARNTGIFAADGDYISLLDSDDSFKPAKLATVAKHIIASPEIDVWTHLASMERGEGVSIVRPTRLPRDGESVADMMFRDREFMQTSTLVVRAPLAKKVAFDPRLRKAQDVDFMIRLERDGAQIRCIPKVLSIWSDNSFDNRVGAVRRPENVKMWYKEQKPHLRTKTRYAFESSFLSYEIVEVAPLRSAGYIFRAFITGAVGPRLTLITVIRTFVKQRHYRKIVDLALRIRGGAR